ncbi:MULTISPECIES: DNA repair exonuclease [unclassified Novosphingobium]|uniref:metallophosphoesterase family protein n=1 Tax=unclassified Novosphingobium TaxID=2644732 RepID=UPI001356B7BC|nr:MULTISPECIES: DNA repair exonuclease [unclassified Novosphingobium]
MRFIHTADWQLGKPFGRFDAVTRAALTEARFDAIDAIGRAAAQHGAGHVIVAGDVFDTEGPDDRTIVQAVTRMARHDCRWWLLPGNHDFARNGGLWDRVRRRGAANVTVLAEALPHEIEDGAWLLPAPLIHRHTLDDPTEAFDRMDTPGARLRIGVGHGSIRDFGTQGEAKNLIAPDRARRSNLDYLALGDWHGMLTVDARTWYSGTPETDRFGRDEPGHCLLVDVQPRAAPIVTPLRTGRFQWLTRDWTVADAVGFSALCGDLLAGCEPAATLLQLSLAGIVPLTDRVAMLRRIEDDLMHQLRHLDVRDADVVARPSEEDLAALSTEGMLGRAGAMLRERVEAGGADAPRARRALERLFVEALREETLTGENAA